MALELANSTKHLRDNTKFTQIFPENKIERNSSQLI